MSKYPPSGYSWLCIPPPLGHRKLTVLEKKKINQECEQMEKIALLLEKTIHNYHLLCKKVEKEQSELFFTELEVLKLEIDALSKEMTHLLSHSFELMEKSKPQESDEV